MSHISVDYASLAETSQRIRAVANAVRTAGTDSAAGADDASSGNKGFATPAAAKSFQAAMLVETQVKVSPNLDTVAQVLDVAAENFQITDQELSDLFQHSGRGGRFGGGRRRR